MRDQVDELELLRRLHRLLAAPGDPRATLYDVLDHLRQRCDLLLVSVYLLDEEGDTPELRRLAHSGYAIPERFSFPADGPGMIARTVREGEPIYAPDVRAMATYVAGDERVSSEYCMPLRSGGRVIGVLNCEREPLDGFADEMRQLLSNLGDLLAVALAKAEDFQRLQRSQDLKSELISRVSHELRTPLTSIHGALGALLFGARGPLPEPVRDLIELADRNSKRLVRLVDDLLDLQKMEAGKIAYTMRSVDLVELISETVAANRPYAERLGTELAFAHDEDGVPISSGAWVLGDPGRLQQVVTNLLSNAAKHSPAEAVVDIRLSRRRRSWRIEVRDRGSGIPEAFQPRVFSEFARAEPSDGAGTGLGLTICKRIVEDHGGEIGFASCPGATTFFVELLVQDAT